MKLQYFLLALLFALIAQSENTVFAKRNTRSAKSSVQSPNYYELLREYEREMKEAGVKSGDDESRNKDHDDWKHIERWKWFWSTRIDAQGNFPDPAVLMREWEKSGKYNAKLKMDGVLGANALAQWKQVGLTEIPIDGGAGRINCIRIPDNNLNTIWIGTAVGGAWKSTDAGKNWLPMTDYLPALSISDIAIHPNLDNIIYVATGDCEGDYYGTHVHYSAGILRSDDGGQTWKPTGLSYRQSRQYSISRLLINPITPNLMLAATNGGIMLSSDAGATWNNVLSGSFCDMEFQPGNPKVVYASTIGGVFKSTNAGKNWTAILSSRPRVKTLNLKLAVTPANPSFVYTVGLNELGDFVGPWLSTDSGSTWKQQESGWGGIIRPWFSTDSITTRERKSSYLKLSEQYEDCKEYIGSQNRYALSLAVSMTNESTLAVGGINIGRSIDTGKTWKTMTNWSNAGSRPYVHGNIHDLIYTPEGKLYAATDGGIYVSKDGGVSWIDLSNGLCISQFYRISIGSYDSNYMLGGTQENGTINYYSNASKWRKVLGSDGLNCIIDYKNNNIAYASNSGGEIYKTKDNWATSTLFVNNKSNSRTGWLVPFQLHPTNSVDVYVGYSDVWRTTSAGVSWSQISSFNLGTLSILEIAKSNSDYIYSGNSKSIKYTTDGGKVWKDIKTPTGVLSISSIEIDPKNPNRIWMALGGFGSQKVLETKDFGINWIDISLGLPSVPVNCLVYSINSPDRIYAGTDIGVYYRDTLTKAWVAYNDGLPATIISDLKIHYGTGKIYAGTFGRGIWVGDIVGCNNKIELAVTRKGELTFCEGGSVTLTAQSGFSFYQWSNGATTRSITIRKSGTYSVNALTSDGCPAVSENFNVKVLPYLAPNISTDRLKYVLCNTEDSIRLTASVAYASYRWNTGDTTQSIVVQKPGKYFVVVSLPDYCDGVSDLAEVKLAQQKQATITKNGNQFIANPPGELYDWYINGQRIPDSNGRTYTTKETSGKIRVAIIDSNGCRSLSEEILVAVEEITLSDKLKVTPNPTTGDILLNLDLTTPGSALVELITVDGKIAHLETVTVQDAKLNMKLTTNNLPAGVYYLRITSNGREWQQQVIKQ